tara:strand:+ start:400 stop:573 length:174 start_codon:yes stop_codon:yes gene_type:complete
MKESDYYRGSPHKPVRDGDKKHKETYEQLGLPIILPKKAKLNKKDKFKNDPRTSANA